MDADVHTLKIKRPSTPSVAKLQALVAADMNAVNQTIIERMQSPVVLIPELAGHLIASGGKRLRPMLTLGSARLLGYGGTRQFSLAACVEFIHTATLLHDDVVDGSDLRRGQQTANIIWGNKATVLVGDFLFARAFELMVEDGSLRVLRILSRAAATIAQGEVDQLTTTGNLDTTEDRYLEVIIGKTAVLFAAACQVASVIAERDDATEAALESYGRNLGIAFQLVDDAIDYASTADVMGKSAGDDFREGKLTLPAILAYARGNDDERAFWRRTLVRMDRQPGDFEQAVAIMSRRQAVTDTLNRAHLYGERAIDALAVFPDSAAKAALIEAADFTVQRAY
ncbi:MAG: polyprenyl synthetase family protein [Sphingomonadales bacterium]|nr:MAG: polyprenyl synthetase family protein [Sphingomonadales bacterium]